MTSIEELKQVAALLQKEKAEEIRLYDEMIRKTTLAQRVTDGACWYPVQTTEQGWSLGEHPYIIVERTKLLDKPHKLKAGAVVSVFAEQLLASEHLEERGVVHWVDRNRMKIIFYGTEFPAWVSRGKLGVQLNFDERSYAEMERALRQVMEAKPHTRLGELREILLGHRTPFFEKKDYVFDNQHLNDSQNRAVHKVLTAQDVAVLHGPPGTGKTTTLVEAIRQLAKRESPILVCAPSNSATDLLTERLAAVGLNVVRVGNVSRVDESLLMHTVEGKLDARPEMVEVKKLKKAATEQFRNADKFRRNFGEQERAERRDAYREAKDLLNQAKMLEDYVLDKILTEADVIACTLVSAMNSYIENRQYHTVIIDEAAQALEPATWIAIGKADRVILAGDPFQLPPTVKSMDAARGGLSQTLLEKCVARLPEVQLLDTQYRMHKLIMGFSNEIFYQNQLKAASFVADWTIALEAGGDTRPIEFIDTAGCGFEEKINRETQSYYNPEEYFILRQHLDKLLTFSGGQPLSIGVLSPYKEQVIFMQQSMRTDFDHFPDADLSIDTIDSFQGQERDVMYISLVRSNDKNEIGFLKDTRRLNVAMTRARKKLILIGDSATLASFAFYSKLLEYCEAHGAYGTAWEWM